MTESGTEEARVTDNVNVTQTYPGGTLCLGDDAPLEGEGSGGGRERGRRGC